MVLSSLQLSAQKNITWKTKHEKVLIFLNTAPDDSLTTLIIADLEPGSERHRQLAMSENELIAGWKVYVSGL